jgi:hypothetical protein
MKKDYLTKDQITEIAEALGMNELILAFPSTVKDFLTSKFGAPEEEEWPKNRETFYTISGNGALQPVSSWNSRDEILHYLEIGNAYRTREEAKAVVELRKHIQKFKVTENEPGWWFYREIGNDKGWAEEENGYVWGIEEKSNFNAGVIMPLSSTPEDREERIRLLKICYSR